jgi:hypothetical protein
MYIDVVNDTDNVNVFVQVDKLAANPDAYYVLRCLEAYLLLLFGCVLVNNTHEDIVDMVVLPYARTVVVATAVPVYNSGCWQRLATPPTRRDLTVCCCGLIRGFTSCDRTTSEMMGLSFKIILKDSR